MQTNASSRPIDQPGSFLENSDDLSRGQIVLVSARWVLVVVGLVLTLWNPAPISTLRVQLLVIFLMAGANFYLHAQTLMRHRIAAEILYAASAADLVTVSLFVLIDGGFKSPLFTFYFPAIVAFAVVFPARITTLYTAATAAYYLLMGLASLSLQWSVDNSADVTVLITRVIMLISIAICGNLFLRIARGRRNAAAQAAADLKTELGRRSVDAQKL